MMAVQPQKIVPGTASDPIRSIAWQPGVLREGWYVARACVDNESDHGGTDAGGAAVGASRKGAGPGRVCPHPELRQRTGDRGTAAGATRDLQHAEQRQQ